MTRLATRQTNTTDPARRNLQLTLGHRSPRHFVPQCERGTDGHHAKGPSHRSPAPVAVNPAPARTAPLLPAPIRRAPPRHRRQPARPHPAPAVLRMRAPARSSTVDRHDVAYRLRGAATPTARRHASTPSDRLATFCRRATVSAGTPPLANTCRKSDRCTPTRLIEPSASTSTAFQPAGPFRMT